MLGQFLTLIIYFCWVPLEQHLTYKICVHFSWYGGIENNCCKLFICWWKTIWPGLWGIVEGLPCKKQARKLSTTVSRSRYASIVLSLNAPILVKKFTRQCWSNALVREEGTQTSLSFDSSMIKLMPEWDLWQGLLLSWFNNFPGV